MIKKEDNFFKEFLKAILPYRWSIIFFTLSGMLLSATYLYFTPSVYEAQAIIKVKTNNNKNEQYSELNPLGNIYSSASENIDQELAILQTFHIHNKAIDRLNLGVQYFIEKYFRRIEIFSNPPIEVKDIKILDRTIVRKELLLKPLLIKHYILIKFHNFLSYQVPTLLSFYLYSPAKN